MQINSKLNKKILLTSILENSVAIITTNPAFKIKFANTLSQDLLKAKNQELRGLEMEQLFENKTIFDKIKNEITNSESADLTMPSEEIKTIDNNNTKIPVKILIKKIKNQKNQLQGLIFVFKDISEIKNYTNLLEQKTKELDEKNNSMQKLLEEMETEKSSVEEKIKQDTLELTEKHTRLLSSINNLSLGFIMTDKYKNINLNNQIAATFFTSLKKQQSSIQELLKQEQINCDLNEQIDKCLNEKISISLSDIQINLNFVNIFISPIIINTKLTPEAMGAIIIIEDKTEEHNLIRSKEDLFAITSHELRTPLTAIYGYTSLIKQMYFSTIQDDQLKIFINNIGILSKKLSMTVSNLLDSSRLEQNKIQLKQEQFNLTEVINEVIEIMERLALEKNLYIKFDPPLLPVMVQGDQIRLMQIINILISNAIKFTQIGGIYITLTQQPDLTKIKIQDTGIGIKQENISMLFDKFQKPGSNLLTTPKGIGLGLHIAKLLIEKMGGEIQLEKTEINKGSTFSFTVQTAKD